MNATSMSRRRMLQLTGASALGVGALAAAAGCTQENTPEEPVDTSVTLTVYDPTGSFDVKYTFAERCDTFEGKTVGFVADDSWEDTRTFAAIKEWLNKNYPSCTVYTQDNFLHGTGNISKDNNDIAEQMKALGVDMAFIGNAG